MNKIELPLLSINELPRKLRKKERARIAKGPLGQYDPVELKEECISGIVVKGDL